jgi:hypothetical protein
MEPVALAAHLDEMAVMHESIEEGRNGGVMPNNFGQSSSGRSEVTIVEARS